MDGHQGEGTSPRKGASNGDRVPGIQLEADYYGGLEVEYEGLAKSSALYSQYNIHECRIACQRLLSLHKRGKLTMKQSVLIMRSAQLHSVPPLALVGAIEDFLDA